MLIVLIVRLCDRLVMKQPAAVMGRSQLQGASGETGGRGLEVEEKVSPA